jgi:hypothetical protein
MIEHQHTATIDLVETELIDGMDSLPLAILLDLIDFGVLVNLVDPFLNILVAVVCRVR